MFSQAPSHIAEMGDRKTGHEQFRDLFKTSGAAAAGGGGGSREQTSVRLAKKWVTVGNTAEYGID